MLNLYEQQRLRQQEEEIARMKQKEKQYLLHKLLNTSVVSNNSSATGNSPHYRQHQQQDTHRSNMGNGNNNFHNSDNRAMNPIGLVVSSQEMQSSTSIQQQTRVHSSSTNDKTVCNNEKRSVPLQTSSEDTLQIITKETDRKSVV